MRKYICGRNSVKESIKNKIPIKKIYISKNIKFEINKNIDVKIVSIEELNKMSKLNHQGIIAELKEFNYYNLNEIFKDQPKKILILDHIQDPQNFGSILRTSNAAGIKHIIIPKKRSIKITPSVLKVASGGQIGIKIIRVDSLYSSLKKIKDKNFWIYATSLDENSIDIDKAKINYPMALIMGNESKGINKTLLKLSDQIINIKMKGIVQSLNVSVATGIILFKI